MAFQFNRAELLCEMIDFGIIEFFIIFCESQVHGNEGRFTINMVSLIRKIVREFFRTKVFLQISDRFFLEFESKRAFLG